VAKAFLKHNQRIVCAFLSVAVLGIVGIVWRVHLAAAIGAALIFASGYLWDSDRH
jgi:hypothetical protein